jgi:hypothetical protein
VIFVRSITTFLDQVAYDAILSLTLESSEDTEPPQNRVIAHLGNGEVTVAGDFRTSDGDLASGLDQFHSLLRN